MVASNVGRQGAASALLTISEVIAEIRVPRATFYRWRQLHKGPCSIKLPNGGRPDPALGTRTLARQLGRRLPMSGEVRPSRWEKRPPPGTRGITRDVRRPWKVGKARSKSTPYMVRWVVAGQVATRTFSVGRPGRQLPVEAD